MAVQVVKKFVVQMDNAQFFMGRHPGFGLGVQVRPPRHVGTPFPIFAFMYETQEQAALIAKECGIIGSVVKQVEVLTDETAPGLQSRLVTDGTYALFAYDDFPSGGFDDFVCMVDGDFEKIQAFVNEEVGYSDYFQVVDLVNRQKLAHFYRGVDKKLCLMSMDKEG